MLRTKLWRKCIAFEKKNQETVKHLRSVKKQVCSDQDSTVCVSLIALIGAVFFKRVWTPLIKRESLWPQISREGASVGLLEFWLVGCRTAFRSSQLLITCH